LLRRLVELVLLKAGLSPIITEIPRRNIRMPALEQIGQPTLGVVDLVLCRQDGRAPWINSVRKYAMSLQASFSSGLRWSRN